MSKIEKNELEKLQTQQKEKTNILHDLGVLTTEKHRLMHLYAAIIEDQEKLKKTLEDRYGKVNINLEDGSYEIIEDDVDSVVDLNGED